MRKRKIDKTAARELQKSNRIMVTSVMEGNKDEAERCIDIAIEAAKLGNYERAEKFLRKADALFPTQKSKGAYNSIAYGVGVKFDIHMM